MNELNAPSAFDVRARIRKQFHHARVTTFDCGIHERSAVFVLDFWVGSFLEEQLDDGLIALSHRE